MPSLACLEYLTKVDLDDVPSDIKLVYLSVPDKMVETVELAALPSDWRNVPSPESTRLFGGTWLAARDALALRLPSVVLPDKIVDTEGNVVLNPMHAAYSTLDKPTALDIQLDPRLVGQR